MDGLQTFFSSPGLNSAKQCSRNLGIILKIEPAKADIGCIPFLVVSGIDDAGNPTNQAVISVGKPVAGLTVGKSWIFVGSRVFLSSEANAGT